MILKVFKSNQIYFIKVIKVLYKLINFEEFSLKIINMKKSTEEITIRLTIKTLKVFLFHRFNFVILIVQVFN